MGSFQLDLVDLLKREGLDDGRDELGTDEKDGKGKRRKEAPNRGRKAAAPELPASHLVGKDYPGLLGRSLDRGERESKTPFAHEEPTDRNPRRLEARERPFLARQKVADSIADRLTIRENPRSENPADRDAVSREIPRESLGRVRLPGADPSGEDHAATRPRLV